jgi:hypothetical protein
MQNLRTRSSRSSQASNTPSCSGRSRQNELLPFVPTSGISPLRTVSYTQRQCCRRRDWCLGGSDGTGRCQHFKIKRVGSSISSSLVSGIWEDFVIALHCAVEPRGCTASTGNQALREEISELGTILCLLLAFCTSASGPYIFTLMESECSFFAVPLSKRRCSCRW